MSGYELHRTADDNYDLHDPAGNVIASYSPPIQGVTETLLPAIMDDLGGPAGELRQAIIFAATGSIETYDDREEIQ